MIANRLVRVTAVETTGPSTVRVWFDDGSVRDVELSKELWGEIFEPLRDPVFFRQVLVNAETGTIEWPNGADFAPTFLQEKGVFVGR
jgi:hypothetical protein